MVVGPDLLAAVENLANHAARVAAAPIPREADMAEIRSKWDDIKDQLPPASRVKGVTGWFAMVDELGNSFSRGALEAIAKFALWFEGYSHDRCGK